MAGSRSATEPTAQPLPRPPGQACFRDTSVLPHPLPTKGACLWSRNALWSKVVPAPGPQPGGSRLSTRPF